MHALRTLVVVGLLLAARLGIAADPVELTWLGLDADKVGRTPAARESDGAPDHHFRLRVQLPSTQSIVAIELREHAQVTPTTRRWSSNDPNADFLAVERDGHRLNAEPDATLGTYSGTVEFDVYAHDTGQWDVHRSVVAAVQLTEVRELRTVIAIAPPRDRLIGRWEMHCASNSPTAFEPMTLTGRVLFVLESDGRVRGYFGAVPITGTFTAAGQIEGTGENADERVEWRGQLENYRSGTTPRGSGSFRLLRSKAACAGDGQWSSR